MSILLGVMVCRILRIYILEATIWKMRLIKKKNNGYFGQLRWPCNVGVGARAAVHMCVCVCVLACECARA